MGNAKGTVKSTIEISVDDAGWAMDAMQQRATAYESTADYLEHGDAEDAPFLLEEVSGEHEARSIARSYREVIGRLEKAVKTAR